ncbi:uncharacterized protein LOC132705404 [Cylas formicarius]|uniref:uncharacterized protein LOC132705404 n=1 Tax=Cylas formicarius TaxID=197179 RepID=UPI0029586891|nr:uncharacterized protein LOC132705404 [Cylas formicarius]
MDKNTFLTTHRDSHKWPYPKPLVPVPAEPPIKTKPSNFYVAKLIEPYCHCDYHLYEPEMGRYKKLAEKETKLNEELAKLKQRMAVLVSDILEHPCDSLDEKMKTIYQTDYAKRGLHVAQYRKLMPAIESPVGIPVKSETIGLGMGYRDPTRFRHTQIPTALVDVCPKSTYSRTPTLSDRWFFQRTGTTEYNDSYSKAGLDILRSSQQYAEPLPSSRRAISSCP